MIKVETDLELSKKCLNEIIEIYESNGWGEKHNLKKVQATFQNTSKTYFVKTQDKELIGFARVLSDFHSTTWISEIVIAPDSQRNGNGGALLNVIMEDF